MVRNTAGQNSDADGQLKLWDTDTRRAVHTARCVGRVRGLCSRAVMSVTHTGWLHPALELNVSYVCPRTSVHATSSGVLNVDAVPGAGDAIFTQGRDGTLKRWQARLVG